MKYRDLPQKELIQKLMATSFDSPSTNKKVFDWCNAVSPMIAFRENERVKLIEKYGENRGDVFAVKPENMADFRKEYNDVLEMETENIPILPINEESFDDESCCYPKDKELWISPKEISILMELK